MPAYWIVEFFIGISLGYLYSTFAEGLVHQYISDAPRSRVDAWKKHPFIMAPFIRTNYSHHMIHHCSTYHQDHVTQFRNREEKQALDSKLNEFKHGQETISALYGNKFSFWGWVASSSPCVPGAILAYYAFGVAGSIGATITLFFPLFMNNYMHKYTHMPHEKARETAPFFLKWFVAGPYMRAVTRHHFLHHRYSNKNYNMVLGSDLLRGHLRKANKRDIQEMIRLGIRVD